MNVSDFITQFFIQCSTFKENSKKSSDKSYEIQIESEIIKVQIILERICLQTSTPKMVVVSGYSAKIKSDPPLHPAIKKIAVEVFTFHNEQAKFHKFRDFTYT